MKKIFMALLLIILVAVQIPVKAQSNEVIQLLLNVEKLSQLKQILSDLKKGYSIVSKGYGAIKDLSEGNFSLHKVFLDGLMEASPTVKKYYKVAAIVEFQVLLLKENKAALNRFRQTNMLNPQELSYVANVYENLITQSLRNVEELVNVVTSGKLQMSDDERLKAIDVIYLEMEDKVNFLRSFNTNTSVLTIQRSKEYNEISRSRAVSDIK
jgi:hypothetical protein